MMFARNHPRPYTIAVMFILMLFVRQAWSAGSLNDLGESTEDLSAYTGQGRWVVVKFWTSNCHVCNQEAHNYVDFHQAHKERDAVMLGISLDGSNREAAESFMQRHKLNYPNLIADFGAGTRLFTRLSGYDWRGTPSFLVFDPEGRLRAQQAGAVPVDLIEKFIAANSSTASR